MSSTCTDPRRYLARAEDAGAGLEATLASALDEDFGGEDLGCADLGGADLGAETGAGGRLAISSLWRLMRVCTSSPGV